MMEYVNSLTGGYPTNGRIVIEVEREAARTMAGVLIGLSAAVGQHPYGISQDLAALTEQLLTASPYSGRGGSDE